MKKVSFESGVEQRGADA